MGFLLDWPTGESQERFAFTCISILLTVVLAWTLWHPLAFILGMAWVLWFVWLLFLQPLLFPTRPEVSPEEEQRINAATWMSNIATVDPTTVKMIQRELIDMRKANEALKAKVGLLETKKKD